MESVVEVLLLVEEDAPVVPLVEVLSEVVEVVVFVSDVLEDADEAVVEVEVVEGRSKQLVAPVPELFPGPQLIHKSELNRFE